MDIESISGFSVYLDNQADSGQTVHPITSHQQNYPITYPKSTAIRPDCFQSFIGNEKSVSILQYAIQSAQIRGAQVPHILLYGPAGVGKTTLSKILAKEIDAYLIEITGSTLSNQSDVFKILMRINRHLHAGSRVVLFIDEIHSIVKSTLPDVIWLPLLEDFKFSHDLKDSTIKIDGVEYEIQSSLAQLQPFTVIGATTDAGMLPNTIRDRFQISCILEVYSLDDLQQILAIHSEIRRIKIERDAICEIAKRSRSNPRIAINHMLSCRDTTIVKRKDITDKNDVLETMKKLGIDEQGFTKDDVRVLKLLFDNPKGIGINSIAGITGISKSTLQDIIEPFLKQKELMFVTTKRVISDKGKEFINK